MRTTIRLNEGLMEQAKRRAAEDGTTFTALVEEGLRLVLNKPSQRKVPRVPVPVSAAKGGVLPGVELNRNVALLEVMDEERPWF